MTPLPKRKSSKGRRNRRRAHDALAPKQTVSCPNCGQMCLPHQVCLDCGHYSGRQVIEVAP